MAEYLTYNFLFYLTGQDSTLQTFSTVHDSHSRSLGRASYFKKKSKKSSLREDKYMMPPITDFASGIQSILFLSLQVYCTLFDEFQDLLENIIPLHNNLYILRDLNLHLDNSNGITNKFNDILTCFDLKQQVNFPTHIHGHWLDLLFTKRISNSIKSVFSAAGISDHLAVISEIDCCKTKLNKEKISKNKQRLIMNRFNSDLIKKPEKDLSAQCQQYDSVLSPSLDNHASVSEKTMPNKPPTPWMTQEIMKAKTLRHNLERTWRRTCTHLDRSRYKHQCHLCNRMMMTKAKSKYLTEVISENSDNPRRLWNSINNILHRIPPNLHQ